MKFSKLFFLILAITFFASCSVNEVEMPQEEPVEVEARTLQGQLVYPLNLLTYYFRNNSNGTQFIAIESVWDNLGLVLEGAGVDITATITFYEDNNWSCHNINVEGVDQNAGAACGEGALAQSFAVANCYLDQWLDSNGTDELAYQNFQNAYCSMLKLINLCLEAGIDADGYCRALDK